MAAVLLVASATAGSAQPAAPQARSLLELEKRSGAPLVVMRSATTGLPAFLGAGPGRSFDVGVDENAPASERAAAFLGLAAPAFGLRGAKDFEFVATKGPDEVAMEHVRYRQVHEGVPVAGAELIVHLRGRSATSVNGLVLPDLDVATTPTLDAKAAAAIAMERALAARKGSGDDPIGLSEARLEIFDAGFYLRQAPGRARLAWFFEASAIAYREFVWIDAHDGKVLQQFSQLTDARDRRVYTAGGGSSLPGTLIRSEGGAASGDVDVDQAYVYSGDTYDYFWGQHGRDSYDGSGATLSSTVDWCDAGLCGSCPCENAFWDGTQMVYGDGFPAADDVVAHELTHAVTEYSANLVYCVQSGALNESFSDIFGETVDLSNAGGTDTPAVRWLMGEDVPGIGAIRNMSDPTTFGDPGKTSDPEFFCATSCFDYDNGGVHINSGVPNHAFALMVDGGTYNSITVTGIGLTKAGKIQYRALTQYLTANATFTDAYSALTQSCTDLIGTAGIVAGDCTEVAEALQAVEMDQPVCVPAVCGNGSVEGSEGCDDGNLTNCDGCDANCRPTGCGNGLTACGETCDDGNLTNGDGCEDDCSLSPGCAIYTAADLPAAIPDLGSATSVINVPSGSDVADVNVVNLSGTHTYVGDLEFRLTSPEGTMSVLVNNVCGGYPDFSLGLDDEAGSAIPCPPTDGQLHLPATPLAAFDGEGSTGNWTLTVLDQEGGDSGSLASWGLLICESPCGNGTIDAGEQCDDGNVTSCDGCDSNCTITGCGNGVAACGEACDDGNLVNGDGCEDDCSLAEGCVLVTATDLPQTINDYSLTQSTIDIALTGLVTDVDIVDLAGSHTFVSDLQFDLAGPAGTTVRVLDRVCGSSSDFDIDLDDEAGGAVSCPMTDGQKHLPSNALSTFDGTPAEGTWTLNVTDVAGGDVGSLLSWGLLVCAAPACAPEPLSSGCLEAGKASFAVADNANDEKDSIKWKWIKGAEVLAEDLGDPNSSTSYALCVYDHSSGAPTLSASLVVPASGLWDDNLPKGVLYKDRTAFASGVTKVNLRTGATGKSKAQLGAKGVNVPMPAAYGPAEMFDADPDVTVQLVNTTGSCWTSSFSTITKNTSALFKAKAP